MPVPGQSIHQDAIMTEFALKYSQSGIFIADQAMPVKPVAKESDKYFSHYLKDIISIPQNTQRANGAEAGERHWDVTTATYQAEEYALRDIVTDRDRANADAPLEPDQDAVTGVQELLLLDREARAAALMFDTSTTFTSYTSALTNGWDDYSNSTPFTNVETARTSVIKNALKMPNVMIMGYEVFVSIIHHPDILARIAYTGGPTNPALINENVLAQCFNVEKVLVGKAVYNSANVNQTTTSAFVWGKYVGLYYINPNPTRKTVTAGVTFRARNWMVKKWREDKRNGDMVQVSMIDDEVVPCAGAGYVFSTAVS